MLRAGTFAGAARSVSKGSAGGPANGALIIATEWNRSGRINPDQAAIDEPASWPTTAFTDR